MTPESPRADVELTEADVTALAESLYRHTDLNLALSDGLDIDCHDVARAVLASDWLADRLAAVEKSRDAYRGAMRNAEALAAHEMVCREKAEAERDEWAERANCTRVDLIRQATEAITAERDDLRARLAERDQQLVDTARDLGTTRARLLAVETLAEGWERRAKYLDRVLDHTEAKVFRKHADALRAVLASPSTHTQRDTETAAQAWDEGWQTGQLWAFSDLDKHAKQTNPYRADSHATEEGS